VDLKKLPELSEERWTFKALAVMDGVVKCPQNPKRVILLLHGLGERGRRIYRKLITHLPSDAIIIAPNAPFPLHHEGDNKMGFAWYFYSRPEHRYILNQDLARSWISELLKLKNPHHLPLTIIGFSQGGYLAPLVGYDHSETKLVVAIGAEFRNSLLPEKTKFRLEGIHGLEDKVIPTEHSCEEARILKERGFDCHWQSLEGAHEITSQMGQLVKKILENYGN